MAQDNYEPLNGIVARADRQKETGGNGSINGPKRKRKRSLMHILRVAAYMLRLKSGKSKSAHVDAASRWKKVMCSMRPLHSHTDQAPGRITEANQGNLPAIRVAGNKPEMVFSSALAAEKRSSMTVEQSLEVSTAPESPAHLSVVSSSSSTTSRYASALNLQELDHQNDESDEDEDNFYDDKYGDEMIDVKAEQFIARFYEQMRLQQNTPGNPRRKRT